MEVLDCLFVDIITGNKQVTLKFNGSKNELIVGAVRSSGTFPTMRVAPLPLFTNVSCDIKPIATNPRWYSPANSGFISKEVTCLLREGIIEPFVSLWQIQLLVVSCENHKKRLVVDYSNTINLYTDLDTYPMPNITDMISNITQYKYFLTLDLKSAYNQLLIQDGDKKYTALDTHGKRAPFGVTNRFSVFQRTIDWIIQKEPLSDSFTYVDNITMWNHKGGAW